MAGLSGLSSGTSSSLNGGIKGYGGLVSGLDRDALIEGMTSGTRSKISKQLQSKQSLKWEQEATRSISSKMISISQKYMSYTSNTNLSSAGFFARNNITATGVNSKYLSVSGTANGASALSILGVKQLARDAKGTSSTPVSNQILSSGLFNTDMTAKEDVSKLEGASMTIKYGDEEHIVNFPSGTTSDGFTYKYDTHADVAASINRALKEVGIGDGKTLGDVLKVEAGADSFTFKSTDTAGNTIQFSGGTNDVFYNLGFMNSGETTNTDTVPDEEKTITAAGLTSSKPTHLMRQETFAQRVGGKFLSFNYNGVTKSIQMPTTEEIMDAQAAGEAEIPPRQNAGLEKVQSTLQSGMNKAFGTGRVKVNLDVTTTPGKGSLGFVTTDPKTGNPDGSSVLAITDGDDGLLGKNGALHVVNGESNRLNMETNLSESGLVRFSGSFSETDPLQLTINGVDITGLTYSSTMSEIIDKINNTEGANVTVSYLKSADKFVISSKEQGSSGKVEMSGAGVDLLFGQKGTDYTVENGQDAIITVQYDGSNEKTDLIRGSNAFTLDGLNVALKDKFGFDEIKDPITGDITFVEKAGNEAVKFEGTVNTELILKTVQDFIKDYNEMLEEINKEVSTKPDRDYFPLTDEQKKEMSEDQIKTWETEAKKGILFNDSTIRGAADELRFLIPIGNEDKKILEAAGITVSTDFSDKGKLKFDETKFKTALEKNPETIKDVFTRPSEIAADGTVVDRGGLMTKLGSIMDKYAKTTGLTKGLLIERAGSPSVPNSILKNYIQTEMNAIDSYVEKLKDRLAMEQDRYTKQFTSLETLISQMNSQSSWLSQQTGGQ